MSPNSHPNPSSQHADPSLWPDEWRTVPPTAIQRVTRLDAPTPPTPATSAKPDTRSPLSTPPLSSALAPSLSLSIREITQRIANQLRPLTQEGRRIVHAQWIKPNVSAGGKGFLAVTLVDTQDNSTYIEGFIWDRPIIDAVLKQGQEFGSNLADREGRCEVFLDVTIEVWTKKSKPYLKIHGLNAVGMKGLRQQQREATIAKLDQEGLLTRNATLPWARPGLRICCIAKKDSDGYRDALTIFKHSGFAFQVGVYNVAVQGVGAVPSILSAFTWIQEHAADFDVILLARGGGSELDLIAFDNYALARAVATCPIPVVTGLGHTADQSVCDLVSAKALATPTAAARFIVDRVLRMTEEHRVLTQRIHDRALQLIHRSQRAILAQRPRLIGHALSTVHRRQTRNTTQWHATIANARTLLHRHETRRHQHHHPIRLYAEKLIQRHRTRLDQHWRLARLAAPHAIAAKWTMLAVWRRAIPMAAIGHGITPAVRRLDRMRQRIHHAGTQAVQRASRRVHASHVQIQAMSPARYFALGLSYVTTSAGRLITQTRDVEAGETIRVHLQDGTLDATIQRKDPA